MRFSMFLVRSRTGAHLAKISPLPKVSRGSRNAPCVGFNPHFSPVVVAKPAGPLDGPV